MESEKQKGGIKLTIEQVKQEIRCSASYMNRAHKLEMYKEIISFCQESIKYELQWMGEEMKKTLEENEPEELNEQGENWRFTNSAGKSVFKQ